MSLQTPLSLSTNKQPDVAPAVAVDPAILKAFVLCPFQSTEGLLIWGPAACLVGPPAVYKTSVIHQVARDLGLGVIHVKGASGNPADLGIPMPFMDAITGVETTWTRMARPDWLRRTYVKPSLVFFDEINAGTSQAFMAALLDVLQDRRIEDTHFAPGTRVMAAMNPVAWATAGLRFQASSSNRVGHFPVWLNGAGQPAIPPGAKKAWCDWYRNRDDNLSTSLPEDPGAPDRLKAEEKRVLAAWPSAFAEARLLVTTFHERYQVPILDPKAPVVDLFYSPPTGAGDPKSSGPWESSRTNDAATRMVAIANVQGLSAEQEDYMVAGFVGPAWTTAFRTFRAALSLPDPAKFLAGDYKNFGYSDRPDRTFVTLSRAAQYVTEQKDWEQRLNLIEALYDSLAMCASVPGAGVDLTYDAFQRIATANMVGTKDPRVAMASRTYIENPSVKAFLAATKQMHKQAP